MNTLKSRGVKNVIMVGDALASGWAKALGGDRKQFELFLNKMLNGFAYHKIVVDKTGKPIDYVFLEVNHAFEEMTGLKREHVIGKKVTEVLLGIEKDPADWIGVYGKVALTGEAVQFETLSEALGKWFKVSAYCLEKGYFVAVFEDITERKKGEQDLWMAKNDWERTFDNVPDFIAILDNQYRIVQANRAMAQQLGATPQQAVGLICYQCVHGLESPPDFCPHTQTMKDEKEHTAEVHEPRLGGDFLVTTTPLKDGHGRMVGSVHVARNITERKKVEDALRENEQRLNRSQEIAHLGSWELDLLTDKLTWSDEVYRIFGLKPQEFGATYEAFLNAVHPDDRKKVDDAYSGSLREGKNDYEVEHRIPRKNSGEVRVVHEKCEHFRDQSGKIVRSVGMVQDVTEQKKAEDELLEIRGYLENLLNYANAPIIVWDPEFKITLFNHAFEHMTGLYAEDVLGKPFDILFPAGKKREAIRHINRALEGEFLESVELPILSVDGTVKTVLWNSANIYDSAGQKIVATIAQGYDITERKELQQKLELKANEVQEYASQMESLAEERTRQLKDVERLAAIGATAGMVGHDIRNPLQAIAGDVFLIKAELASLPESEEKDRVQESLDGIEKNIDYINKIVADLQDFARPLNPHAEDADLKLIIEELLRKNETPENVKITVNVEVDARRVLVDSTFINRIMYNLVNNAVQAMPEGGQLTIRAYKEGNDTVLTVSDTGVGIPEAVKGKLFTPMFTTKSKGQGFGLAVVKRMTESLGGTVSFESQEGKGTTFIVRLRPSQKTKPLIGT